MNEISKHGYWIYSNGNSHWGLGLNMFDEIPLECTVEVHNETNASKKVEWHSNRLIEIAKKKAEDEAKRKK